MPFWLSSRDPPSMMSTESGRWLLLQSMKSSSSSVIAIADRSSGCSEEPDSRWVRSPSTSAATRIPGRPLPFSTGGMSTSPGSIGSPSRESVLPRVSEPRLRLNRTMSAPVSHS